MIYQSTSFDIDYIDPWFFVGSDKNNFIEVYPTNRRKQLINWEVDIEDRSFGILRIASDILEVRLYLTIELLTNECSELFKQYLIKKYVVDINESSIDIHLEPHHFSKFKLVNQMRWKEEGLFITDVIVDFMDKQIIIR